MGLKKPKVGRRSMRGLNMQFDNKTGILSIEVPNPPPQFQNAPVVFLVTGDGGNPSNEQVNLDANGKGTLQFDRTLPPVFYAVKVLNAGPLTDDQRLGFTY